MSLNHIFENNRNWVKDKLGIDPAYFSKLAEGQQPKLLYIGCSDSRVSAEELMGLKPGEVFVHRNIANMVTNTDLSVMSVIEYAVDVLKVEHVVVCGHHSCGGVKAAMEPVDMGLLNPWLRNIRDVYRLHQDELDAIQEPDQRYRRLAELNVREQCLNVIKTASVQRAHKQRGLLVHGWIFDVQTGHLRDLEIDFRGKLERIMRIYQVD